MTINQFRLPKLTFFGHELSKKGVAPSEKKIAAVVNARAPNNISEVRSFVQLVQYSAKFIPNFSQEAEPLRKLLRKGHVLVWGIAQQKAFERLKQLMSTSRALAYFQNECKTRIVADAGPDGLGAVLLQQHGGRVESSFLRFEESNGGRETVCPDRERGAGSCVGPRVA